MTATVHEFACSNPRTAPDDLHTPRATCHRGRGHDMPHRGPEHGTGKLVSWYDELHHDMPGTREPGPVAELLEQHPTAELWTDDQGWTYARGVRQPDPLDGTWDAIARVGPAVVWSLAVLLAWLGPALVVIVWRAALR